MTEVGPTLRMPFKLVKGGPWADGCHLVSEMDQTIFGEFKRALAESLKEIDNDRP